MDLSASLHQASGSTGQKVPPDEVKDQQPIWSVEKTHDELHFLTKLRPGDVVTAYDGKVSLYQGGLLGWSWRKIYGGGKEDIAAYYNSLFSTLVGHLTESRAASTPAEWDKNALLLIKMHAAMSGICILGEHYKSYPEIAAVFVNIDKRVATAISEFIKFAPNMPSYAVALVSGNAIRRRSHVRAARKPVDIFSGPVRAAAES